MPSPFLSAKSQISVRIRESRRILESHPFAAHVVNFFKGSSRVPPRKVFWGAAGFWIYRVPQVLPGALQTLSVSSILYPKKLRLRGILLCPEPVTRPASSGDGTPTPPNLTQHLPLQVSEHGSNAPRSDAQLPPPARQTVPSLRRGHDYAVEGREQKGPQIRWDLRKWSCVPQNPKAEI